MKRKIFTVFLAVCAATCLCFGLAACNTKNPDGGDNGSTEHTHSLTHTETVSSTCTVDGNVEYWCCSDCGKYFSDSAGTTEITQAQTVIAATGHTSVSANNEVSATCTTAGKESDTVCSVCHETLTAGAEIPVLAHTPAEAVKENEVAATCTEGGSYDSVIYCSVCKTEISRETVTDPALSHDTVNHEAKAPACTEIGWEAYQTCTRCDYSTYQEIPAAGHTEVIDEVVAPTCTEMGLTEGKHCSVCNQILVAQTSVFALGHDYINHETRAATCLKSGWYSYKTCSRCDYSTYEAIAAIGHHTMQNGICSICGNVDWEYSGLNLLDLCNSTYGYTYLGTMDKGSARQSLYKAIDAAVRQLHNNVEEDYENDSPFAKLNYSSLNLTFEEAVAVWKTYLDDNPLYYWFSNTAQLDDDTLSLFVDTDYIKGAVRAECNLLVFNKIQEYTAYAEDETSAYQIALAYHDRIISAIDYAYAIDGTPETALWAHSIIGVFKEIGGVCESYTKTFQLLLNVRGIENILVNGMSGDEAHAWNLIKLDDGQWYWCDLTWDDTPETGWGISYQHFCVNDAQAVDWTDGDFQFSISSGDSTGTPSGSVTFLDYHIAYSTSGTSTEFLYSLPSRSTHIYHGVNDELKVRQIFRVGDFQYAVTGYHTVQLTRVDSTGKVVIPETVHYRSDLYTVISVGVIGATGLFGEGIVFYGNITSVSISSTVIFIWEQAFRNTTFEKIIVSEDNSVFRSFDEALYTKYLFTLIAYPNANKRTAYTIPNETRHVANYAFDSCKYLEKLNVGKNVYLVGYVNFGAGYFEENAPKEEGGLGLSFGIILTQSGSWSQIHNALVGAKSIEIEEENINYDIIDGVLYQNVYHVEGDVSLVDASVILCILDQSITSFTIRSDVYRIDTLSIYGGTDDYIYIFEDCLNLEAIYVEDGNQFFSSVGGILYDKEQTRILSVPKAIKGAVVIPDTVISIATNAFYNTGLTSITIGKGVTEIRDHAFLECKNLTSIIIPDSVISIGEWAFGYCTSLTSVMIGSGVTEIGNFAFSGCTALTSVTFKNTSGWRVSYDSDTMSGTSISSTDLADPATAAKYLTSTYYDYYWKRS